MILALCIIGMVLMVIVSAALNACGVWWSVSKPNERNRQMLMLSRNPGETIDIDGGRIQVMVTKILGDRVWLGVTAPIGVLVDRREVTIQRMMAEGIPLSEIEAKLDAADQQ